MEYISTNQYMKKIFGRKIYKISVNGGFTCPNRDGKLGERGCIFCSGYGSGDFSEDAALSVSEQIEAAKKRVEAKMPAVKNAGSDVGLSAYGEGRYMVYFQSFTNTYAPVERLRALFTEAIEHPDIVGLSIATRPDCLPDDVIELLAELNEIKPVWVELGLQTINESTAKLINRGYELSCYDEAVRKLRNIGVEIITHMIIGLPHETKEDILSTAKYIGKTADGIKLQLMHILKNTKLLEMYENGEFKALTEEEYIEIVCEIISVLPEKMVIHRLTGDGNPDELIAPLWSLRKMPVLNAINHRLKELDIIQGIKS